MNRDEYLKNFAGASTASERQQKALAQAHEIRKFEIDLYWKRGTYFWTFIALAFTGYTLLVKEGGDFVPAYIVTCLGFLFSLAWYCVNRGSSSWQRNWEKHVDLLEDEVMGPLYKTVINHDTTNFFRLSGPYHFSPSRINHVLSLTVTSFWFFLIVHTLFVTAPIKKSDCFTAVIISAITLLATYSILVLAKASVPNEPAAVEIGRRTYL